MKIIEFSRKDLSLLRRTFKYIKPYKIRFTLAFICILSNIGFGIIQPLVWGSLLADLFAKNLDGVFRNVIYVSVLYFSQTGLGFLQSYLFSFLTNNIIYDFKMDMYRKILDLPVKAFDDMRIGDFLSRIQGDTAAIANIITNQFLNTIVDVLRVIVIGITVFAISVPLSAVVLAAFPVSYFIFSKFGKVLRKKNDEMVVLNDDYFSILEQSLSGIREVKSMGIKNTNLRLFGKSAVKVKDMGIRLNMLNTLSQTLSQTVNFASQIAVMGFGGYLIFKGALSMQYYIAFSSYSNQFSFALMNITQLNSNIQQVLTSLTRVFGVMDNLNYEKEIQGEKDINDIKGNIRFVDVSFQYNEDAPVLKNISFEIQENRKVAFVGTSGSGKTTILNLLLRFYKPTGGSVLIDNRDISEYTEDCLRRHVSIVRQEPFLFNMTIRENLMIAKPTATEEELQEACKAAYIHDYIMGLPKGFDSKIGENGVNLSGGQKQRLAIARALLKKSKIILFDEATSSLDNESQHYIREAINELSKNHTIIIIAHRLSTIIEADEIMVLEDGGIVGRGTHGMLISRNSIYKRLYETELNVLKYNTDEVG